MSSSVEFHIVNIQAIVAFGEDKVAIEAGTYCDTHYGFMSFVGFQTSEEAAEAITKPIEPEVLLTFANTEAVDKVIFGLQQIKGLMAAKKKEDNA